MALDSKTGTLLATRPTADGYHYQITAAVPDRYDLAGRPGHSYGSLTRMLTSADPREQRGYAEQHAAAFALLARVRGFPSRVHIVDLTSAELLAAPEVLPERRQFTLASQGGFVFFNDHGSDQAGVIRPDGSTAAVRKYLADGATDATDGGTGGSGGTGGAGTGSTPSGDGYGGASGRRARREHQAGLVGYQK